MHGCYQPNLWQIKQNTSIFKCISILCQTVQLKPLISKISYFRKALNINEIFKDHKDKMIKQLSQNTAEQLCAQQVITSLPDCIKQLVDNAIDADATYIKIILHEYGKQRIEVIDNGFGIDNFDFLGKKGSTSKNKGTDQFNYLGFRGEAIHSIARVSAGMTIQSKCSVDGLRRLFDCCSNKLEVFKQERLCHGQFNFQIPNKQTSKSTGTKVTIQDIFKNLPVRHIELHAKHKLFLQKTNQLIKQFCLVYPQIQFIFINNREGKQEVIIQTTALKSFSRTSWLERIKEMDEKIGNSLIYISGEYFKGYVLNNIQSGSSRSNNFIRKVCHYLYLNRRPIDVVPLIQSTFNEMYKKYNSTAKYAFLINLELDHTKIDVNLTPNKRQIFIRKEILEKIIKQLKEQISQKVVEDIPSLNNFEDKKKVNQIDGITYLQPSIIDHLSKSGISAQRKIISFPINRRQQDSKHQNHSQHQNHQKSIFIRENPNGKSTLFVPQNNGQNDQKKEIIINKPARSLIDLPQLPKINVDMNKLKQRLNSRLSGNFGGLKKLSNQSDNPFSRPAPSNEIHQVEMTNQKQLDDFRKENQQKKVRQEQEDARKRANFLKQVKIEYGEQDHKKIKPVIQKYNMSTSSKNRELKSKENIMEQQIRRKQIEDDGQSYYHHQKIDSYSQIQHQNSSFRSKSIEASDKNLEERIKAKLSIDMSQIFTKFNQTKSGSIMKNDTNNHSNHEEVRVLQTIDIEEQKNQNKDKNQIQLQQKIQNISENVVQPILIMDGKGNETSKSLKKQNFRQFQIIGQFNRGFILCVFNHEYFLVDQHAASQKHYYQLFLSKNYRLESIRADDRQNISGIQADQIDQCRQILNEAGFLYQIIDRCMLQLQKCPVFFDMKLGLQYFWQIVEQKKDLNRVPKFTAMCAMKACKTAIVVGNALRYSEMKEVVHNLSNLESPWNCPHGRPTLVQLGKRQTFRGRVKKIKKAHQYQF